MTQVTGFPQGGGQTTRPQRDLGAEMVKPEASTCGKGPEHTGFTAHPREFLDVESKEWFPLGFLGGFFGPQLADSQFCDQGLNLYPQQ